MACLAGASAGSIAVYPVESPPAAATERHLAYAIYTSGSTGRPKGATLPHSGICNQLLWMQDACGLTPKDRVLRWAATR